MKIYSLFLALILIVQPVSLLSKEVFDYSHKTFVLSPDHSFLLPEQFEQLAINYNRSLSLSKFFDTSYIVQDDWTQSEFKKDPSHQDLTIKTKDNTYLTCSWFKRGNNKLIIVGPGFTNNKERMAPFVHMFHDYDILILNFRGHGIKSGISLSPLYNMLGIDSQIRFGYREENDVFATVEHFRTQEKYDEIIGLGICFGAFIFAKTQALAEEQNIPLFDKLILDGCWLSLKNFSEKVKKDPYLVINPQTGGTPSFIKSVTKKVRLFEFLEYLSQKSFGLNIEEITLNFHLNKLKKTPLLFFYGKDDLTIDRQDFETIWNNINHKNKIAIITSNPHVHNHLKEKEVYKSICDVFINEEINKAINTIKNQKEFEEYLAEKNKSDLKKPVSPDLLKPKKIQESFLKRLAKKTIMPVFYVTFGYLISRYFNSN